METPLEFHPNAVNSAADMVAVGGGQCQCFREKILYPSHFNDGSSMKKAPLLVG
jgi:hypothetical protein